jgi:hypothetical protein
MGTPPLHMHENLITYHIYSLWLYVATVSNIKAHLEHNTSCHSLNFGQVTIELSIEGLHLSLPAV